MNLPEQFFYDFLLRYHRVHLDSLQAAPPTQIVFKTLKIHMVVIKENLYQIVFFFNYLYDVYQVTYINGFIISGTSLCCHGTYHTDTFTQRVRFIILCFR